MVSAMSASPKQAAKRLMFELYGDMVAFTGNLGKLAGGTLEGVWVVGRVDVENKGGYGGD